MSDNENLGLLTPIWGPHMWIALHSITFGYPSDPTEEEKNSYKNYFQLVGNVLPCKHCRDSYQKFIMEGSTKLTNDDLENRKSLTHWLYRVHNAVNEKLGIDYLISYEDVVNKYEGIRAKCSPDVVPCIMTAEQKSISFKVANKKDCPIIAPNIALNFVEYAKKRNMPEQEINDLYKYINIFPNKNSKEWEQRNEECHKIIKDMRLNGVRSIEQFSEWKDLPTKQELSLILKLSTTIKKCELVKMSNKLSSDIQKYHLIKK